MFEGLESSCPLSPSVYTPLKSLGGWFLRRTFSKSVCFKATDLRCLTRFDPPDLMWVWSITRQRSCLHFCSAATSLLFFFSTHLSLPHSSYKTYLPFSPLLLPGVWNQFLPPSSARWIFFPSSSLTHFNFPLTLSPRWLSQRCADAWHPGLDRVFLPSSPGSKNEKAKKARMSPVVLTALTGESLLQISKHLQGDSRTAARRCGEPFGGFRTPLQLLCRRNPGQNHCHLSACWYSFSDHRLFN